MNANSTYDYSLIIMTYHISIKKKKNYIAANFINLPLLQQYLTSTPYALILIAKLFGKPSAYTIKSNHLPNVLLNSRNSFGCLINSVWKQDLALN